MRVGRWPSFLRLANPGLDGKNGSGGKLLRTDRPGVDAFRCGAEIVQQRRDLDAEPDPKTTTTKTQRIMRRVDFDIATGAVQGAGVDLDSAEEVIRTNRHLLTIICRSWRATSFAPSVRTTH
jgi:hypothetical protein